MVTKEQLDEVVQGIQSLKTQLDEKVAALEETKTTEITTKGYVPVGRSSSDEQVALRAFGVSHPKQLLEVNVAHPRFAKVDPHLKHLVFNFKKAVDVGRSMSQMFNGDGLDRDRADGEIAVASCKGILHTRYGKEILAPAIKAFGSTVVSGGDEWVPTAMASSYAEEYELEHKLQDKFKQLNMPSNPFDMPVISGVTKAKKIAENTAMSDSSFTTDKIQFSATKLAEYYILPEELTEDSAPDFLAAGRDEVVKAQMRAVEVAIISGDDDGTHIDSDTQAGAANLAEKSWKGLRRQALANSANGSTYDFANAASSKAKLQVLKGRGGKYFVNPSECLWLCGPKVYSQLVGLDEVLTMDNYGPMATVLQGALASYMGVPVYVSDMYREDLNATGVYDGVTTDRGSIILVNKSRWFLAQRRAIKVKLVQDLPNHDRWLLASYQRVDFKGHAQDAGEVSVVLGYNIAL